MKLNLRDEFVFFYDNFMKYVSFFGSPVFWPFAIVLFSVLREFGFVFSFTLATVLGLFIEYAIKFVYKEKRPDFEEAKSNKSLALIARFQRKSSFPSGHVLNIAAFTVLLASTYRNMFLTALFSLIVLSVAVSRVYLKRHYVKDVIGGAVLGVFVGYLVHLML